MVCMGHFEMFLKKTDHFLTVVLCNVTFRNLSAVWLKTLKDLQSVSPLQRYHLTLVASITFLSLCIRQGNSEQNTVLYKNMTAHTLAPHFKIQEGVGGQVQTYPSVSPHLVKPCS